jgi:hypothetical protein
MQPGNQEYVDSFCRHVRGNPTYADGYGRWFSNPLHVQSKALDLVYKLHWQRAEGASMWDYYLLQHYVPEYLMPLFDLASSVWEARHWLMSTNLTGLNYVPVYRTQMNMETEFRRVVRKFARWRRGFFQRTYPHTGEEWLEPYPERVRNLPDDMPYEEKQHQLQEWRREAVTAAKSWLCAHPFDQPYGNYEDESTFRKNVWLISMSGTDYYVAIPGHRNRFMFPLMPSAYEFPEVSCQSELLQRYELQCVCKRCQPNFRPYWRCQRMQAWSRNVPERVRCLCVGCNIVESRNDFEPVVFDAAHMHRHAVPQALGRNPFRWENQILLNDNIWRVHNMAV